MTVRLFAALVPPLDVIEGLEDYIGPRREADRRLRWVLPEQWHITTLFVDDCPDRSLDPLVEGLAAIAGRTPATTIRLGGGGCFPDPFAVRAFYLRVTAGEETLRQLSKSCRAAASTAGAEADGARFVPHLTVARTRTRFDGTRWLGILDSFGSFEWYADSLHVVRSHLGEGPRGRPRYETLAELGFRRPSRAEPGVRRPGPTEPGE